MVPGLFGRMIPCLSARPLRGRTCASSCGARAVHRAVDDALIDISIYPTGYPAGDLANTIYDAVKNVLIHPRRSSCDGVCNRTNDDLFIQGIEVVLVPQEGVAAAQNFAAFGETDETLVTTRVVLHAEHPT